MFIGTVLKSLEIEDLVCCNGISRSSFLARSFIRSEEHSSSLEQAGSKSFNNNNVTPSEGEDKFYEASEDLVDPECLASPISHPFEDALLKLPTFTRISGLLPVDTVQNRMEDVELTDTLDSFVKAQIIIYDQNSSLYNNIDMQVD